MSGSSDLVAYRWLTPRRARAFCGGGRLPARLDVLATGTEGWWEGPLDTLWPDPGSSPVLEVRKLLGGRRGEAALLKGGAVQEALYNSAEMHYPRPRGVGVDRALLRLARAGLLAGVGTVMARWAWRSHSVELAEAAVSWCTPWWGALRLWAVAEASEELTVLAGSLGEGWTGDLLELCGVARSLELSGAEVAEVAIKQFIPSVLRSGRVGGWGNGTEPVSAVAR